jgi:hypothetical protein
MSTTVTYGLISALFSVVMNLVAYFLGYQGENMAQGQWFQWLGLLGAVITFLGIRAVREESPDKAITYGRAVGTGFKISLIGSALAGVYIFIHFKFISVEFTDYLVQMVREQQSAKGLGDAQLDQMEKGMRFMYNPVGLAIFTPVMGTIIGTILSLIFAAFLKKAPPGGHPPPM